MTILHQTPSYPPHLYLPIFPTKKVLLMKLAVEKVRFIKTIALDVQLYCFCTA